MTTAFKRVTVNLVPKAVTAMEECVKLTDDDMTETINRALQVYRLVLQGQADGGGIHLRNPATGNIERHHLL